MGLSVLFPEREDTEKDLILDEEQQFHFYDNIQYLIDIYKIFQKGWICKTAWNSRIRIKTTWKAFNESVNIEEQQ